ncbi:alpha/beta fold hydrolase [Alkalihalobacillus sp. R86527]|uniref:alpha/beta fold hydrolase n=1 Tax=Alkalihalobacillus sp. R86527 TaxID=3093863 RepID=UPI00366D1841
MERIYMLHGFMGTGDLHFQTQKEFFSKHYEVISPDLPGHGVSSIEANNDYVETAVEWLVEDLEANGPAYLVGLSLGATLSIHTALKRPDLVKGMVLTGYTPFVPDHLKGKLDEQHKHFSNLEDTDPDTADYFKEIHGTKWYDTLTKVNNLMTFDYPSIDEETLATLKTPTLLLNGGNELYEVEAAAYVKSKNDSIHIGLLPGAGHIANIENPHLYNEMVLDFLRSLMVDK